MRVLDDISQAVGSTPMVRLSRVVPPPHEVLAKVEFLNPTGSVKDRIARYLVDKALAEGRIGAGGVVLEASSGNTAMGLAMMSILRGLRCRMVVRRQTSREKLDSLRALGVELVLVDGSLPPEHPESYNRKAQVLAAEDPSIFFPDQHHNRDNNEAHYRTTGPEIWRQAEGRIDLFVAGMGTGGTVSGVARYLKEQDPRIRVVAIDVEGSVFSDHFAGRPLPAPRPYLLEGLGDEEVIGCPEFECIDAMEQVSDGEAFRAARELAAREGLLAGGSSGAALWGVRQVLARETEPRRVVTLLPDSGNRYLSTIYCDRWMAERGFLAAAGGG